MLLYAWRAATAAVRKLLYSLSLTKAKVRAAPEREHRFLHPQAWRWNSAPAPVKVVTKCSLRDKFLIKAGAETLLTI